MPAPISDNPGQPADELSAVIRQRMKDPATVLGIGTYGALAEFERRPDDRVLREVAESLVLATHRGACALAVPARSRAVAWEHPAADGRRWRRGLAICVPATAAARGRPARFGLTPLGADRDAVLPEHRDHPLFDLGLGIAGIEACVRVADADLAALLQRHAEESVLAPGSLAMAAIKEASPHRVFRSAAGRIEVYQPIGSTARGRPTPEGPHTHVLPRLLATGRRHDPRVPVPRGWQPCLELWLPPGGAPAGSEHDDFEALLERFGDDDYRTERRRVEAALDAGLEPEGWPAPRRRIARSALRVALRHREMLTPEDPLVARWRARHDRARATRDH